MRKSSNGASHVAGGPTTNKSQSGTRFFENVAGGMMRPRSSLSRRKKRVLAIATTFRPGWTSMMRRKEERRLSHKAENALSAELVRGGVLLSPSPSSHEI